MSYNVNDREMDDIYRESLHPGKDKSAFKFKSKEKYSNKKTMQSRKFETRSTNDKAEKLAWQKQRGTIVRSDKIAMLVILIVSVIVMGTLIILSLA